LGLPQVPLAVDKAAAEAQLAEPTKERCLGIVFPTMGEDSVDVAWVGNQVGGASGPKGKTYDVSVFVSQVEEPAVRLACDPRQVTNQTADARTRGSLPRGRFHRTRPLSGRRRGAPFGVGRRRVKVGTGGDPR